MNERIMNETTPFPNPVLSIMNSVLLEDKTVLNLIGAQVICIADITIRKYIEEEVLSRTNKELSNE